MCDMGRIARWNAVAVDERDSEVMLKDAPGLFFVAAADFQYAAVIKECAGTDQRQRAFGIRVGVEALVDKADVAAPRAALFF
ncbi:hypothetical protein D3C85_1738740 [compost metagenome]